MERLIYVGVDVHKDENSLCAFNIRTYEETYETKIPAGAEYLLRYLRKIEKNEGLTKEAFVIGYEAGPTGMGLCRALRKNGYICHVIAPTTIQRASGERVKTDRLDARKLAKALAFETAKMVYILDNEDENTKEFTRCRNTAAKSLKKAKQHLLSFLLRMGVSYPETGGYWTQKFERWLKDVHFEDPKLQRVFERYYQEVCRLTEMCEEMDEEIEAMANEPRYKEAVDKLVCFKGIQTHTALSLVCEIGDFRRFRTPGELASYLGLVPGQNSSGLRVRYTGITKAGNSRLRLLLIEATKGIKLSNPMRKSKRIKARQSGQSPNVIAYADKACKRIKLKMRQMEERGKNYNIATTAGARELANFIWGMMNDQIL